MSSSPSTSKSWLTPTRRCGVALQQHQWRQLYHVIDHSTSYPRNCFLGDESCIVQAVSQRPNASYWCILKVDRDHTSSTMSPSSTLSSNDHVTKPVSGHVYFGHVQLAGVPSTAVKISYTIYTNAYRWEFVSIRYECTTVDPFDAKKKYMEFTSMVRLEGKFYALSLQGALAVLMQDVDKGFVITGISSSRGVPSVSWRYFKEYLVELNGEILLIFLIHQKSVQVVDQVEVFRLGLVKLDWIKVERLREKTLFLDECGIWAASSAAIGCRENCIYFTQGSDKGWWIYDMESCCISPA